MPYEEDYILRMIKDMVRALASVILGKRFQEYPLPDEDKYTDMDRLYIELIDMADAGHINDAENKLLSNLIPDDKDNLEVAIGFYQHINQFSDEFLEEHDFSREEILEGIENLAEDNGIMGLEELVKTDI